MIEKEIINELIKNCYVTINPVLKEYMLLPANAFFRHSIKHTEKYFGKKEADRYRAYTEKIKTTFSPFSDDADDGDDPCLKDIMVVGLKKRDERLSEAILYSVFIYPFKIIRKVKKSGNSFTCPVTSRGDPDDNKLTFMKRGSYYE